MLDEANTRPPVREMDPQRLYVLNRWTAALFRRQGKVADALSVEALATEDEEAGLVSEDLIAVCDDLASQGVPSSYDWMVTAGLPPVMRRPPAEVPNV